MLIWTRRKADKVRALDTSGYRGRDRAFWGALSIATGLGFDDPFTESSDLAILAGDDFSYNMADVLEFDNDTRQYYLDIELWHNSKYRDWEVIKVQNDYTDVSLDIDKDLVQEIITIKRPPTQLQTQMLEAQYDHEVLYTPEVISSITLKETLTEERLREVNAYQREKQDEINLKALEHFVTTRGYLEEVKDQQLSTSQDELEANTPRQKELMQDRQDAQMELKEYELEKLNDFNEYKDEKLKWYNISKLELDVELDETLAEMEHDLKQARLNSKEALYIQQETIEDFINVGKVGVAELLQWTESNVNVDSTTYSEVTTYKG